MHSEMPQELPWTRGRFSRRVEGVAKDHGKAFLENTGESKAVFTLLGLVWSYSRINETKI